jgi:hypothetical protein
MSLTDAIDTIREKLLAAGLWTTILVQIRKQNSLDGTLADAILEVTDCFLEALDEDAAKSIWEETDTGMQSEYPAEELGPFEVQQDLRMELLDELIGLAWEEARRTGEKPTV